MSEQQMNDSAFSRLFILMILAMTGLTIIIMVLASFASSEVNAKLDERYEIESTMSVAERIAPEGVFSAVTVDAPVVQVVATPLTGEQVYASCAACHANGTLNAPIVGDVAAWNDRLTKGIDTLYENAIKGIGSMPAKGGNGSLTSENVKDAVDYMLENSK